VLTRATAFLAIGFFTTSLALSIFAGLERKPRSILSPGAPTQQGAPGSGGVLDQIPGGEAPVAPGPSEPEAPRSQ
jgi:preprotein translocase subunit SecG